MELPKRRRTELLPRCAACSCSRKGALRRPARFLVLVEAGVSGARAQTLARRPEGARVATASRRSLLVRSGRQLDAGGDGRSWRGSGSVSRKALGGVAAVVPCSVWVLSFRTTRTEPCQTLEYRGQRSERRIAMIAMSSSGLHPPTRSWSAHRQTSEGASGRTAAHSRSKPTSIDSPRRSMRPSV
jgi:hypothetical protein